MRDFSSDTSALSLNTATLGHNLEGHGAGWSPEQVIEGCVAHGFGGITWWGREVAGRAREIGEKTRAAGLAVTGFCRSPFLMGPLAPASEDAMMAEFRASIDMAAELGTPYLVVCVGGVLTGSHSMTESLKRATGIVAAVTDQAAACNVQLGLEPFNPVYGGDRSCLVTVRDALNMCAAIDHPSLTVAVDVYHVWWDLTLADELKRGGAERIAGYHLCDWLAETSDVLLDRGMMGDGVADLKAIRRAVEDAGFTGFCEVEIFSAENWWKRDPNAVLSVCVERFKTVC